MMIERLFGNEDVRQRLLAGPMGPYLDVLVSNLLDLGYCHSQARKLVRTASALGDWLAQRGLSPANAGKAELWTYMTMHRRTLAGRLPEGVVGFTRLPALFQSVGILSRQSESPADPALRRFEEHLANVRGVTPSTQESYRRYVRPFILGLCDGGAPDWSKMTSEYISEFVLRETGAARAAKGRIVSAVRTFLRFMICEGNVPAQLVHAIPRVRRWRYANLPKHLSAGELDAVMKACQSDQYGSLRDRAFIALLARLGVRAGELRHLRLEDMDWAEGLLHIKQSKSGHGRTLPLPADAGALMANYIRRERPVTDYREIFITSVTPRRPLGDCVTTTFVKIFLNKIGLDGPGRGCHSFRHTAATLMVQNGASLKEVADVLGHRSLATTGIYIKLDQPSLRDVALPWKGGNV
jgi:site-specific recombinase XerD